jgi:ferredoxin
VEAGTGGLEVVVDRARCRGYGICAEICSEVFKLDAQGFAYAAGPVPAGLGDAAREAAESCPEEALAIRGPRSPQQ